MPTSGTPTPATLTAHEPGPLSVLILGVLGAAAVLGWAASGVLVITTGAGEIALALCLSLAATTATVILVSRALQQRSASRAYAETRTSLAEMEAKVDSYESTLDAVLAESRMTRATLVDLRQISDAYMETLTKESEARHEQLLALMTAESEANRTLVAELAAAMRAEYTDEHRQLAALIQTTTAHVKAQAAQEAVVRAESYTRAYGDCARVWTEHVGTQMAEVLTDLGRGDLAANVRELPRDRRRRG